MLYIVKQIFYQDWSAFSVPGPSWPIHTTPFWLSEGVWLDFFPQSSVLAESLWLLSPSNFDSIMQMSFLWRLSGNFKIIILIKHAAIKAGQRSSASLWEGNWAGAPERGLPLNLIYIHLFLKMMEQDWILFNFHALQWNLCSVPSIYPVSSFVCSTAQCLQRLMSHPSVRVCLGRALWQELGGVAGRRPPLHSRITSYVPFLCLIWT